MSVHKMAAKLSWTAISCVAVFGFLWTLPNFWTTLLHLTNETAEAQVLSLTPSAENPIVSVVYGPDGSEADIEPQITELGGRLSITLPEPQKPFQPGKYRIEMWIWKDGVIYNTDAEFNWGVLVVNFDQATYKKGAEANIGLGVLDDYGRTICDADILADVVSPSGKVEKLSTQNNKIEVSGSCGPQTVTNEPDYKAKVMADEAGAYIVRVTANTKNGIRQIEDKFEVEELPQFEVKRIAPTRIYPPEVYTVTLKVTANQDFQGIIKERVPANFKLVSPQESAVESGDGYQAISWERELTKGSSTTLIYMFDAPDISPELFKLGPLEIGGWRESREWQIASDAVGDIYLLWASSTLPAGWSCNSCVANLGYNQAFPRMADGVSALTGADTHTHTSLVSTSTYGQSVGMNGNTPGGAIPSATHVHGYSAGTINSPDFKPPYRDIRLINANTTTIPNGAIAMFDTTSSTLPSGWSYYSQMEGLYLRGASTTATGGAVTHTHSMAQSGNTGLPGGSLADPGNGFTTASPSHSHYLPATSPFGSSENNDPPFIEVVFAIANSTTTLPRGVMAMFDATPPTNWSSISGVGTPYYQRLLKGAQAYTGTGGGRATHDHGGSVTITSSQASLTVNNRSGSLGLTSSETHTHDVTLSIQTVSTLPRYRDIILAKYNPPSNPPSVSSVSLNGGNSLVLTPNATTTFYVNFSASDPDGCSEIFSGGGVTTTVYRSGVGSACGANNQNCYIKSTLVSNSCTSGTSANATASVDVYYYAQATDVSSTYSGENWLASVSVRDVSGATSTAATSTAVELLTMVAIDKSTSTVSYGNMMPNSNTSSTNQSVGVINAGNSTSSLKVWGTALSTGGSGSISDSYLIADVNTAGVSHRRKTFWHPSTGKYWVFHSSSTGIRAYSSPNGSGWSDEGVVASTNTNEFQVWPLQSSSTVYLAFGTSSSIYFTKGSLGSPPTWSSSSLAIASGTSPSVIAGSDDKVWIGYIFNEISQYAEAKARTSQNGGQSFDTPQTIRLINSPDTTFDQLSLHPLSSGQVAALYKDSTSPNYSLRSDLYTEGSFSMMDSFDYGSSFDYSAVADPVNDRLHVAVSNAGEDIYFSWTTTASATSPIASGVGNGNISFDPASGDVILSDTISHVKFSLPYTTSSSIPGSPFNGYYCSSAYYVSESKLPFSYLDALSSGDLRFYSYTRGGNGGTSLATSSQHYASSTFTYNGLEPALSDIATAISGFFLPAQTSTSPVSKNLYWGLGVPAGKPAGTYSGKVYLNAIWSQ